MAVFKYRASDENNKVIAGLVEADSESAAIEILKDKNYDIVSLQEESSRIVKNFNINLDRIKPKDVVSFARQFAVLISASVALVQSLKLLADQTENSKMKAALAEIADEVDGGMKLSDSLSKRGKIFSNFFVSVVRAGESSGKLDEVLNYLADELEKDYDMSAKIKGAMIYPAFVMFALGGVAIIMITFVVPKLTAMMVESGGELPLPTRLLMGTSDFMIGYWYLLIMLIVGLVAGFKLVDKIPGGKMMKDSAMLRIPVFGKLLQRIYLVRFTRSMQTLIIGGVSITKALDISADVVGNSVYQDLIIRTKKEVEDGNSISSVFINSDKIPTMVSQMMKIGEKTGRLDLILARSTDFYSREIDNIVANLMTLMEPVIMVVMGVGVGIMVMAVIMPMYNLASQY